jgi:hypothetical protein
VVAAVDAEVEAEAEAEAEAPVAEGSCSLPPFSSRSNSSSRCFFSVSVFAGS